MDNSINKILGRLSNVGNPIFLLRMLQEIRGYIKKHPLDYPISDNFNNVYFDIEGEISLIENMLVTKGVTLPAKANVITFLLKEMRSVKNIKKYQEILEAGDESFSTNLTSNRFALIVLNQIRKN
ncbi:hypothetical protein [Lactococcus cremoris]|uniref:hypothetical protein n=1 Tax=Lactococcus lactis subsp. cremoris TaxID=1359 RepID=UPI0021FF1FD4|nr:hypothetical protein [Lactococcus cremoris]UXV61695.1 hypothetical protein LLUC073_04295 [Lactococcus cremoris]